MEIARRAGRFWTDLYHRSMTVYWPVFFASAALIFIVLNAVFALPLSGSATTRSPMSAADLPLPLSLFYFSIETLATVGYGDMHPQTNYGHLVATIEIFTGMSFLAVMTGLIFARFSRPRARFVFAEHPVVALHQGQPTLMIRVANARNNTISQATARLWLFRVENTSEGTQLRRYLRVEARATGTSDVLAELDPVPCHRRQQSAVRYDRRTTWPPPTPRLRSMSAASTTARHSISTRANSIRTRIFCGAPLPRHHQYFAGRPAGDRLQQIPRRAAGRSVNGGRHKRLETTA